MIIDNTIFEERNGASDILIRDNKFTPSETNNEAIGEYVLIFETHNHDAFAHWVFESAIFLRHVEAIQSLLGRTIKILYKDTPHRKYKRLFFDFFKIEQGQLVTEYNTDDNCIIAPMFFLTDGHPDVDRFTMEIESFLRLFDPICPNIRLDHLFLPRSESQNYAPNDRKPDYSKVRAQLKNHNYDTIDCLSFDRLSDQIHSIRSYRNIWLDYGSSLFVNGLLSGDSDLHVIGNLNQHSTFPLMKCLFDQISKQNNISFV